jgi:hypothetical protein
MNVKISVPIHSNKDIKIGSLRHLLKQVELFDYFDEIQDNRKFISNNE